MRPTLALVLFLTLLAVGGTLYFALGRSQPQAPVEDAVLGRAAPTAGKDRPAGSEAVTAPVDSGSGAPAEAERTAIAATPPPAAAPAKAAVGTTLVGRLVDAAGGPVAGAEVLARSGDFDFGDGDLDFGPSRQRSVEKIKSDAAGRFEIPGVKPGSVRVTARAPGFVPLSKPGVGVPAVERLDLGDLALEASVILEGRVVDSRGVGVPGARLHRARGDGIFAFDLEGENDSGPPPLSVCAADGSFRIDELASGPWRLRITSEEHPDKQENGVTQRSGERVSGLVFALEDGYPIAGRVHGVPAASVADVTVVASPPAMQGEIVILGGEDLSSSENRRRAKIAADGSFTIKGLRPGNYQVQARVRGSGPDAFWPRSASERVEAKSGDRGVVIAWQPSSVLTFQAVDARTKAPVELLSASAQTRGAMGFVDLSASRAKRYPEGRVRLEELRPRDANDRATLMIVAAGYRETRRTEIALARGLETDLGVVELEPVPTVEVRVVDAVHRGALEGARVELREVEEADGSTGGGFRMRRALAINDNNGDVQISGDGVGRAKTDEQGLARLNSLPGKRGKLSVRKEGYAPFTSEPFDMPEEGDVEQQVALDQGGSVEITLLSAEGTPVSGARIEHRAPGEAALGFVGGPAQGRGAATDAQGKVTLSHLAPGLHRFRPAKGAQGGEAGEGFAFSMIGGEESAEGWGEVEVVRATTASLVLHEPEQAELTGRVRESGSGLAGASLTLKPRGGQSPFEGMEDMPFGGGGVRAKSDGEGRYRFERVEAGSYDLIVRHATRAMAARFPVEVEGKSVEFDIDLPVSILEGRITDTENKPVAGARVWASKKRGAGGGEVTEARGIAIFAESSEGGMVFDSSASMDGSKARTDEDGRYVLRGVESDVELEVNVDAKDAEPAKSEPLIVALGQTRTGVDVQVAPAGTLKVKVLAAAGTAAGPCLVHAEYLDPQPEGKRIEPKMEFAQGGSVTLKGLRPGKWKLHAQSLGGFGGEEGESQDGEAREVLVLPRETVPVELTLP
ncbi:MAG: carboxypeptidase regulatory-like domain-containing protein [Planctomycetes bacterium]|nr:carboxypeptidase regulatory-like domain-containing protein [Planctomycetota bacterium]